MHSTILSVQNLAVQFTSEDGVYEAVKGISFDIPRGKIIGIVGESGSGKSVTSLAIMRLLANHNSKVSGSIQLNTTTESINVLAVSESQMTAIRGNKIAMIFQEPMTSLNPVHTCGAQVSEAIRRHQGVGKADAKAQTIKLFTEVQLPNPTQLYDRYPHEISGGQKQRVLIAMALSCDPELLIADEPTTALDVTVQKNIVDLLKRIRDERNMSMIFISHDLGVISEIADEVIVMYRGDILEHQSVNDIFNKPQNPYTIGLLACRPNMNLQLKRLPTVNDFLNNNQDSTNQFKAKSLVELIEEYAISDEEIKNRRAKIYAQAPIVSVKNLQKWYPISKGIFTKAKSFHQAVNDVSFDIYPGETLGLVGESGCGKTTLGRCLLRLIEPTNGEINYRNTSLTKLSAREMRSLRKELQIVFQDPYSALNPKFTIGAAIMEPMQVHGLHHNDKERKKITIQLLEQVGLSEAAFNKYPHEFSGGQRQRICIARALALQPKVIICDESVSALDVSVQAQVLNLLSDLQEKFQLSYLFISHDLSVVKHFSDRMLVMNAGQIVEQGFPEEIYLNPKQEYTQKLIAAIPGKTLLTQQANGY
ncbi:MAG: Glutathione import ATP-binding protein GsiA [Bacteroidota bacterium]|jgi:peptide/nickel transport system ATP-binding protein